MERALCHRADTRKAHAIAFAQGEGFLEENPLGKEGRSPSAALNSTTPFPLEEYLLE
ncbi:MULTISPECIES: hypothetical protein [Brasilonema]|uniref:hypothetical protein n=1 Tax=Brasilonema TaxID=383614 RepID=UPI00145E0ECB|nr:MULTISPECIES: hypothetical protein [Brasilonema]